MSTRKSAKYRPTAAEFLRRLAYTRRDGGYYDVLSCMCTRGVCYVLETCGKWLIEDIVSSQSHPKVQECRGQRWRLDKLADNSAILTCFDGDEVIFRHEYESVDFPVDHFELYSILGWISDHGRRRFLIIPYAD